MKIIIRPKKITHKNFKKFGDVICTKKVKPININDGYAKRFHNLGNINTLKKKLLPIFCSLLDSNSAKCEGVCK